MAYLDLSHPFAAPAGRPALPDAAPAEGAGFSALEWSVIALARRDPFRSVTDPGRIARAMGSLFGLGTASRLADERLEALRRLAVFAWRRGFALPQSEIDRFLAAGFTLAQLERLVESVTGLHIEPRRARAA